ncbi:MAG TPA: universal stress protein [Smithellaceae bacterium]|nr:universal stress protein [Smithellaceae bacterium]
MQDYKNILYAMDLDDEHVTAIIYALEFAQKFQSRIHMVYVNDSQAGYRHPTEREDAIALKVKESVPASLLEEADIVYAAAKGDTAEEIVRYAGRHAIDLLIVGHRHRSKFISSLSDSTDVNIIDEARIPVLVVPED